MPYYVPDDWNRMITVSQAEANTKPVSMRPTTAEEAWQTRKPQGFSFLPPNMQSLISTERPGSPGWVAKKLAGPLPEMGKAIKETRWRDLFNLYGEASAPVEGSVKLLGQEVSKQALLDALFLSVGMTGMGGKIPKVPKGKVPKGKVPKAEPVIPPVKPPVTPQPLQQKMLDAMNYQKRLSVASVKMRKETRAPRFGEIETLRRTPQGEQTFAKIGEALKGKIPYAVGKGEGKQFIFTKVEKNDLYNQILQSGLKDSEVFPAQIAWKRIFDPKRYVLEHPELAKEIPAGKSLRPFEVKFFEKVWGEEFASALVKDQKWLMKAMQANDIYFEIYYNSLLGGKAVIRNFIYNAFRLGLEPVRTGFRAAADVPLSGFGKLRPREFYFRQVVGDVSAAFGSWNDSVRESWRLLKTGERFVEPGHEMTQRLIKGKLGRIVNIPSSLMDAGDAFFYGKFEKQSLYKQAFREAKLLASKKQGSNINSLYAELKANPSAEMMVQAQTDALEALFRGKSKFGSTLINLRDVRMGGLTPFKLIMPFVKVPVNLTKFGLENSPLAAFNWKMYLNIARRDPAAAKQVGDMMLGSATAATFAYYAWQGNITGEPPENAAERDRYYQIHPPWSVKIGDNWISYQQIPILNMVLPQVVAVVDAVKNEDDKTATELAGQIVFTIGKGVTDQAFVTGLSDTIEALTDPERSAENFAKRQIPSLVPASGPMRLIAQGIDPTVRKPQNPLQGIMAQTPGLSQKVPPRLTAEGEEIQRETPWFMPMNIKTSPTDPIMLELNRLEYNLGFVAKEIDGIALTSEQHLQYQQLAGQAVLKLFQPTVNSPTYKKLPEEMKIDLLDKLKDSARKKVRLQMLGSILRGQAITPTGTKAKGTNFPMPPMLR